jgi:hypothetical protein
VIEKKKQTKMRRKTKKKGAMKRRISLPPPD